jgi:hypothetical protein
MASTTVGPMSNRDANLLRAAAIWTVFVWGVFIRNVVRDRTHSTGFVVVHVSLAVVSLAFAVVIWRIAMRAAERRPSASGRP